MLPNYQLNYEKLIIYVEWEENYILDLDSHSTMSIGEKTIAIDNGFSKGVFDEYKNSTYLRSKNLRLLLFSVSEVNLTLSLSVFKHERKTLTCLLVPLNKQKISST